MPHVRRDAIVVLLDMCIDMCVDCFYNKILKQIRLPERGLSRLLHEIQECLRGQDDLRGTQHKVHGAGGRR